MMSILLSVQVVGASIGSRTHFQFRRRLDVSVPLVSAHPAMGGRVNGVQLSAPFSEYAFNELKHEAIPGDGVARQRSARLLSPALCT
jgi:hypothetical protein